MTESATKLNRSGFVSIDIPEELAEPLIDVVRHYIHAKMKHPCFPDCIVHQGSLITEEVGEAVMNANDNNVGLFKHEVGQVCAVSLRTLIHLQHK